MRLRTIKDEGTICRISAPVLPAKRSAAAIRPAAGRGGAALA
jgi:hypothetical protein